MGATSLHSLPYPEGQAQPQVHLDVKALADAVDALPAVSCTSTSRPAHRDGRRILETDTGEVMVSRAGAWRGLRTALYTVSDSGFPVAPSITTSEAVIDRITVPAAAYVRDLHVVGHCYWTNTQDSEVDLLLYSGASVVGRVRFKGLGPVTLAVSGYVRNLSGGVSPVIEMRMARASGTGTVTPSIASQFQRLAVTAHPIG